MVEILLGMMAGRDFDDVVKHVLPKRKQVQNSECCNRKSEKAVEKEEVQHSEGLLQKTLTPSSAEGLGMQGGLFPFFRHNCTIA